ncbi:MAG: MaoC family dehydratase [Candidatus Helarchaeota archaeon]
MNTPKFEDLKVGDEITSLVKEPLNRKMIREYGYASGDRNPIHMDDWAAWRTGLNGVIAHGLFFAAYMQQALTDWAGSSDAIKKIEIKFIGSCRPGDIIISRAKITGKNENNRTVDLELKQYTYTPLIFGQLTLKNGNIDNDTLKKNLRNAKVTFNYFYEFEEGKIKEINRKIDLKVDGVEHINFLSIEEGAIKLWANKNENIKIELKRGESENTIEFELKRERQSIAGIATVKLH